MTNQSDVSSIYLVNGTEKEFCHQARLILNCGIGGTICFFGLIANFVSYAVLNKGRSAGPVATFLLRALALTDNLFLISWLVFFSLRDLFRYINYNSMAWRYIRIYTYPMIYIGQCATVWMTVIIAITRYTAVCIPYTARQTCSVLNIKIAVGCIYFTAIIYNLPRFFENEIQVRNESVWIAGTWLGNNQTYQLVYLEIMYYIFTFALPLTLLIVLNTRLTIAYRAIRQRRYRMRSVTTNRQHDDINITLVMIVVVAVFVVCQGPARLAQIIWQYRWGSCRTVPFFIMEISTILEVLNSSVNFLIYFGIRNEFRTQLVATLCRPASNPRRPNRLSLSTVSPGVRDTETRTEMIYTLDGNKTSTNNGNNGKTNGELQMPFLTDSNDAMLETNL